MVSHARPVQRPRLPFLLRLHLRASRGIARIYAGIQAILAGFWLGILGRDALHLLDQLTYDQCRLFDTEEWNRRGLFDWEKAAFDRHFGGCTQLLVGGAGGGREVLALLRLGCDADGFECHPGFVEHANRLFERDGIKKSLCLAKRDECPQCGSVYDGLIVGWSAYMQIQGRSRRVAFLRQMRAQASPQAPLLLSFRCRSQSARRFRLIALVANTARRFLRREPVDLGDDLAPNYVHYFTEEQIAAELQEAGFRLLSYATEPYGHAIAFAAE